MDKPISCSIKSPVPLKFNDSKVDFSSGVAVIDITFNNTFYTEVQEIHFKNYYTASISVLAKTKPGAQAAATNSQSNKPWRLILHHFPLMLHPHNDQGGEEYFTIGPKQLNGALCNITALRLILHQPSPVWKEFYIDDIRLYKSSSQAPIDVPLPAWMSETGKEESSDRQLKGVTSVSQLSKDLQNLWALTVQAGSQQAEESLGRYDIDGSYEINLLSYS